MKYQASIDLSQPNNSHTQAFNKISEFAAGNTLSILEVGCSSGYFGSALINHGHQVWGIEPDEQAASVASESLTFVFCGFIEDFFSKHQSSKFDVIVFGDVLEHLLDPVSILRQCSGFLNKDGIIVASLPNVSHFAVRAMLLEGRWEYSDLGILDRTHLAFYTRDTLIDLFSDAGYEIKDISAVRISAEQADELCNFKLSTDSIQTVKRFATDDHGYDFQYVLSASFCGGTGSTKHRNESIKNEDGLRIVVLVSDPSSSIVTIRLRSPLTHWATKNGGSVKVLSIHEDHSRDLLWADAIVFQREASSYTVKVAEEMKKIGKKIIFEIDDLLTNLPDFLSHHKNTMDQSLPFIEKMLSSADAISVSTSPLAEQLQNRNKKIRVTPNYSEKSSGVAKHFDVEPNQVTLIVASSDQVLVEELLEPLKVLNKKYNLKIVAIGPIATTFVANNIKVTKVELMSHPDFKAYISSIDNGIGIIPLDESTFSKCKSPVKYFDYSSCGIPSVCSKVMPYKEVIEHKHTGMLVESSSNSWIEHIEMLILSSTLRRELADSARDYILSDHSVRQCSEEWKMLLNDLMPDGISRSQHASKPPNLSARFPKLIVSLVPRLLKIKTYTRLIKAVKRHGISGAIKRLFRKH